MEAQTTAGTTPTDAIVTPKPTAIPFVIDDRCPIQYVTVYNDRAEVTRLLRHHFDNEGVYDLVFEGFSPSVDLTSLHVSGGTGKACTILEVSYQTTYEDTKPDTELTPLDQLQKEFDQVQTEIDQHTRELARLGKQRKWLDGRATKLMNQDGQLTNNDLESMQQFLDFYHKNLLSLDQETTNEEDLIKTLTQKRDNLRAKMNEHGVQGAANRRKAKREVTITVHVASGNIDVALEIAYLISNCSWSASYDVRVNSSDSARQKTQLTYYGIITNKSQENWPDVQVSLSTATPSLGGALPKLATLKIGYEVARYDYDYDRVGHLENARFMSSSRSMKKSKGLPSLRPRLSFSSNTIAEEDLEKSTDSVNVLATETEASMSSSSFTIPRRATIDADGKPHKVTVSVLDLSSTFTYTVIPKLSLHAYLKASTINTSDKQLLAGPVSVFMDNNFITHSAIDNVCLGDTFDLPLGTDASVKVEYKPVKKLTDTQGLLSKVHHENIRHETHLTNTKSTEVTVFVYEQVPLSSDEKIKVKLNQPDLRPKEQNPNCIITMNDTNNIEWKCILQARGECRLPLDYSVEWPKDRRVEYTQA